MGTPDLTPRIGSYPAMILPNISQFQSATVSNDSLWNLMPQIAAFDRLAAPSIPTLPQQTISQNPVGEASNEVALRSMGGAAYNVPGMMPALTPQMAEAQNFYSRLNSLTTGSPFGNTFGFTGYDPRMGTEAQTLMYNDMSRKVDLTQRETASRIRNNIMTHGEHEIAGRKIDIESYLANPEFRKSYENITSLISHKDRESVKASIEQLKPEERAAMELIYAKEHNNDWTAFRKDVVGMYNFRVSYKDGISILRDPSETISLLNEGARISPEVGAIAIKEAMDRGPIPTFNKDEKTMMRVIYGTRTEQLAKTDEAYTKLFGTNLTSDIKSLYWFGEGDKYTSRLMQVSIASAGARHAEGRPQSKPAQHH